jgi:hypothetical protein
MSTDHAELPVIPAPLPPASAAVLYGSLAVPAAIAEAGDRAARRFLEFFAATIRNKNTRLAYWCFGRKVQFARGAAS